MEFFRLLAFCGGKKNPKPPQKTTATIKQPQLVCEEKLVSLGQDCESSFMWNMWQHCLLSILDTFSFIAGYDAWLSQKKFMSIAHKDYITSSSSLIVLESILQLQTHVCFCISINIFPVRRSWNSSALTQWYHWAILNLQSYICLVSCTLMCIQ